MERDYIATLAAFAVNILICLAVIASASNEIKRFQDEAVERGYAEWVVVPEDRSVEFRWKEGDE